MTRAAWCRYYDGIVGSDGEHRVCKAGVEYKPLRTHNGRSATYICYDPESVIPCPHLDRFTEAEIAAQDAAVADHFRLWMDKIAMGICPECDTTMAQRQVGACVYADPCGHRLFQGQAEVMS